MKKNIEWWKKHWAKNSWFKHIVLGIGAILFVVVVTLFLKLPAFFPFLNFSNDNNLGEAIGGLTAPAVGMLSALMIYYTVHQQIESTNNQLNEQKAQFEEQKKQLDLQTEKDNIDFVLKQLESIKDDFYKFGYNTYFGNQAINSYFNNLKTKYESCDRDNFQNPQVINDFIGEIKSHYFLQLYYINVQFGVVLTYLKKILLKDEVVNIDLVINSIFLIINFADVYLQKNHPVILSINFNNVQAHTEDKEMLTMLRIFQQEIKSNDENLEKIIKKHEELIQKSTSIS